MHPKISFEYGVQVEGCKLRDYGGDYELFLEKNSKEAKTMADKEVKQKELQKSQIKSKSKVRASCQAFATLSLISHVPQ